MHLLGYDHGTYEVLATPGRDMTVNMPMRRDNGTVELVTCHPVHHHLSRGPATDGGRFSPDIDLDEVRALAIWMTWTCALLDLPVRHRYTSEISRILSPDWDVPTPDTGADEQTAAWMIDTCCLGHGGAEPWVVIGKSIMLGGSLGLASVASRGLVHVALAALRHLRIEPATATAAVQGFGTAGRAAARFLADARVTVVAVSDEAGSIYAPAGLDLATLDAHVNNDVLVVPHILADTGGALISCFEWEHANQALWENEDEVDVHLADRVRRAWHAVHTHAVVHGLTLRTAATCLAVHLPGRPAGGRCPSDERAPPVTDNRWTVDAKPVTQEENCAGRTAQAPGEDRGTDGFQHGGYVMQDMIDLDIIGINHQARTVYLSLLGEGRHTTESIAAHLHVPKYRVEHSLFALHSVGLVHILKNGRVQPVDPRLGISAALARRRAQLIREQTQIELAELLHHGNLIHGAISLDAIFSRVVRDRDGVPADSSQGSEDRSLNADERAELNWLRAENARLLRDCDALRKSVMKAAAHEDDDVRRPRPTDLPPCSSAGA